MHFKLEKKKKAILEENEQLVPTVLFLLRMKSLTGTVVTQCAKWKSRFAMGSQCCGPSGWRIILLSIFFFLKQFSMHACFKTRTLIWSVWSFCYCWFQ